MLDKIDVLLIIGKFDIFIYIKINVFNIVIIYIVFLKSGFKLVDGY